MNENQLNEIIVVPEKGREKGQYLISFRKDIAQLVLDQKRTTADVAKELMDLWGFDLISHTVGCWVAIVPRPHTYHPGV